MLVAHCGGKVVEKDDLALVEVPEVTDTYMPVGHFGLANLIQRLGQDLLHKDVVSERYALAGNGSRMFGTMTFGNGVDMGLTVGFRNSYDKSMRVGVCIGAKILVCDNLAFSGDITMMRKHSSRVWEELEDMLIAVLYKSKDRYFSICDDAQRLKQIPLTNELAWQIMGRLFYEEVLTPAQLKVAFNEWHEPIFKDFHSRNAWSLYNSVNQALKSTPPNKIMEKHAALHKTVIDI